MNLHDFDSRLARTLLHGLQTVELGLRVLVAHTLGKADRFGHLNPASLNSHACDLPSRTATLTEPFFGASPRLQSGIADPVFRSA